MSISMHIQNFAKIFKTVQDIKRKRKNYDRRTDGWTNGQNEGQPKSYIAPPPFQSRAIRRYYDRRTNKWMDEQMEWQTTQILYSPPPLFQSGAINSTTSIWGKLELSENGSSLAAALLYNWAATCDFQQCGILTSVDSDKPVQSPVKVRNSKC